MGKVKEAAQDFLDAGGYRLGYDAHNIPSLDDFEYVLDNQLDAQSYWEEKE